MKHKGLIVCLALAFMLSLQATVFANLWDYWTSKGPDDYFSINGSYKERIQYTGDKRYYWTAGAWEYSKVQEDALFIDDAFYYPWDKFEAERNDWLTLTFEGQKGPFKGYLRLSGRLGIGLLGQKDPFALFNSDPFFNPIGNLNTNGHSQRNLNNARNGYQGDKPLSWYVPTMNTYYGGVRDGSPWPNKLPQQWYVVYTGKDGFQATYAFGYYGDEKITTWFGTSDPLNLMGREAIMKFSAQVINVKGKLAIMNYMAAVGHDYSDWSWDQAWGPKQRNFTEIRATTEPLLDDKLVLGLTYGQLNKALYEPLRSDGTANVPRVAPTSNWWDMHGEIRDYSLGNYVGGVDARYSLPMMDVLAEVARSRRDDYAFATPTYGAAKVKQTGPGQSPVGGAYALGVDRIKLGLTDSTISFQYIDNLFWDNLANNMGNADTNRNIADWGEKVYKLDTTVDYKLLDVAGPIKLGANMHILNNRMEYVPNTGWSHSSAQDNNKSLKLSDYYKVESPVALSDTWSGTFRYEKVFNHPAIKGDWVDDKAEGNLLSVTNRSADQGDTWPEQYNMCGGYRPADFSWWQIDHWVQSKADVVYIEMLGKDLIPMSLLTLAAMHRIADVQYIIPSGPGWATNQWDNPGNWIDKIDGGLTTIYAGLDKALGPIYTTRVAVKYQTGQNYNQGYYNAQNMSWAPAPTYRRSSPDEKVGVALFNSNLVGAFDDAYTTVYAELTGKMTKAFKFTVGCAARDRKVKFTYKGTPGDAEGVLAAADFQGPATDTYVDDAGITRPKGKEYDVKVLETKLNGYAEAQYRFNKYSKMTLYWNIPAFSGTGGWKWEPKETAWSQKTYKAWGWMRDYNYSTDETLINAALEIGF